ncbi:MAG: DUF6048 family protein [Bacteroidia bacterium]
MRILYYTFVLCLLAVFSFGQAEKEKKVAPKRTDNFIRMRGIRVGMDLTRPFQYLWVKGTRYGYEFSADMELRPNLFPVFENGYDIMKITTKYINYKGQGTYSRIGVDYNLLEAKSINERDLFYVGFRYGFTLANQQVKQYMIDSYWGSTTSQFGNQSYFAHWGEILVGIKGEIFHNFYMGWSVRGKVRFNKADLNMPPVYFIPGYGLAEKKFTLDFTYSVFYNLPWDFRKQIVNKKVEPAKGTTQVAKNQATKK